MPTAFWFRRLALPFLIVLGLSGLWSAYWFYAQAQIEIELDREVARLQVRGGQFVCEDRRWRGFPLRIAVSCGSSRLELPGGPVIETAKLEAAGYLNNLRRIVSRTDRIAVEGEPKWSFRGRNVAVSAGSKQPDRLAFSASGEALTLADGRTPAIALDRLEVGGFIEGLPRDLSGDLKAVLSQAARLGSRLTIETFTAQMADVRFTASGTVELGPEGPTGTLFTTVSDYKGFLDDLERRGAISSKAVRAGSVVIGLLQSGRQQADGEATLALRFHAGQVFWGPFAVAEIPPLQ